MGGFSADKSRAHAGASAHGGELGVRGGRVVLPTGDLGTGQLMAILELLPCDLTFVDADDVVQFFSLGVGLYPRPLECLGRSVYECHPERTRETVRRTIQSFRDGSRDFVDMWTRSDEGPVRVRYCAVRGDDGSYLGSLEIAQPFGDVLERLMG